MPATLTAPPRHPPHTPTRPAAPDDEGPVLDLYLPDAPTPSLGGVPAPGPNLPRLRLLRKAVAERPEERFDMAYWVRHSECGTVCCAAGSYVEANPDCGLVLIATPYPIRGLIIEQRGNLNNSGALTVHFGISGRDAARLFSLDYYDGDEMDADRRVTKSAVLARIDAFIASKEPAPSLTTLPDSMAAAHLEADEPDPFDYEYAGGAAGRGFAADARPEAADDSPVTRLVAEHLRAVEAIAEASELLEADNARLRDRVASLEAQLSRMHGRYGDARAAVTQAEAERDHEAFMRAAARDGVAE